MNEKSLISYTVTDHLHESHGGGGVRFSCTLTEECHWCDQSPHWFETLFHRHLQLKHPMQSQTELPDTRCAVSLKHANKALLWHLSLPGSCTSWPSDNIKKRDQMLQLCSRQAGTEAESTFS